MRTKRYKYIRNFYPLRPYTNENQYKRRQYPVLTLMELMHERGELEPEQAQRMAPHRPTEELYDLKNDPDEVNNLADDPAHEETLKHLREQLDAWICETGDQGQVPEDPEVAMEWDRFFEKRWASYADKLGFDPREEKERYLEWWGEKMRKMKS